MAYATQDDIVTLYSERALYVADRDGDGIVDAEAVAGALENASTEIDTHIGARHSVPIDPTPPILRDCAVDIALYRLALSRDVLTDEMSTRYKDRISLLKDIAAGRASLNLPGPVDPDTGAASLPTSPRPVVAGGPSRIFSRDTTRGL